MDIVVFVATERHEGTYNADAVHPNGHVVSLEGQGHVPTPCDCEADQRLPVESGKS